MIRRIFTRKSSSDIAKSAGECVKLAIDGKEILVPKGTFLVDAIKKAGSSVPTICYHPDLPGSGGICRLCLVESAQRPGVPIVSCRTPVAEGMQIVTQGTKTNECVKQNMAMMFADHPSKCLSCPGNTKCKGQALASELNIGQCGLNSVLPPRSGKGRDETTVIYRDSDLCINCDVCVFTCQMMGVGALTSFKNGAHTVGTKGPLNISGCIQCGQCINRCPIGALSEKPEVEPVLEAIRDPSKIVVFQMAPAIRVSIAEEFGFKPGQKMVKNELVTALKKLGQNVVVMDTDFAADLTIIEEGFELIERLYRTTTGKRLLGNDEMPSDLPMFTSCCPAWILYVEKNYPEIINHLSTTKSPMQMMSSLIKSYWAKDVKHVDPKNIVNVAIMPCTAKKHEKERPEMITDYNEKVTDYVLTTRELGKMLRQLNIDPTKLKETPFDKIMGESTGAAVIFGATGGVMEAALRTAYEVITGRPVPFKNLNIEAVRGMEGIKEASIKLEEVIEKYKAFEGFTLKIAVANGIQNARKIVEVIKEKKEKGEPAPWHFIEVMACPGGCIGGGGQPKPTDLETRKERTKLIFKEDAGLSRRESHKNQEVMDLYSNFLKEPLGHNSHHYLHRKYSPYEFDEAFGKPIKPGKILSKYPREQQYLLPIIIEKTDKKGFISDSSLTKISGYLGLYSSQVEGIISSYHYFQRKKTSDVHIYMCICHNCAMKGQGNAMKTLQTVFKIESCHGGMANGGEFCLHTVNWLAWCVNNPPAMMIKRKGTDYIESCSGYNQNNVVDAVNGLIKMKGGIEKWPQHNIDEVSLKSFGDYYSFLDDRSNLVNAVTKAVEMGPDNVIKEITEAELVGRGGAGFKTAVKWKSAKEAVGNERYVVCNADEGLPSTYKDWCILRDRGRRKEVIAGMGICAKTIGAEKCYIYLRYEYRNLMSLLESAIKQVQTSCKELAGLKFQIRIGGGPYVAGEENAQFESIQGAAPLPRKNRPANIFPTIQGLFNKPTVINNVETFWAVPHIIEQGGDAFVPHGLPKLLSVTGDVDKPYLLECFLGNYTLKDLINEIGAKDIVAAEVGGTTEPIIFSDKFDTKFGFGPKLLSPVGSVVLFNSSREILDIYDKKLEFMVEESCKQCVPCRDGSRIFLEAYRQLRIGSIKLSMKSLRDAAMSSAISSICAHGKALSPLANEAYNYVIKRKAEDLPKVNGNGSGSQSVFSVHNNL